MYNLVIDLFRVYTHFEKWTFSHVKRVGGVFSVKSIYRMLVHRRNQIQDWLDGKVESWDTEGAKRRWKLF
jgi:hypothetical protein